MTKSRIFIVHVQKSFNKTDLDNLSTVKFSRDVIESTVGMGA